MVLRMAAQWPLWTKTAYGSPPTKERAEADAKVLTDRIALVLQHLVVNRSKKDGIWSRKAVAAKTAAEKAPKAPKPPADELEGDEVAT